VKDVGFHHNADLNYFLQFGQSAMMVASWEGHLGIVEALISAKADANLQDGVIDILYSCNL